MGGATGQDIGWQGDFAVELAALPGDFVPQDRFQQSPQGPGVVDVVLPLLGSAKKRPERRLGCVFRAVSAREPIGHQLLRPSTEHFQVAAEKLLPGLAVARLPAMKEIGV